MDLLFLIIYVVHEQFIKLKAWVNNTALRSIGDAKWKEKGSEREDWE